MLRLLMFLAAVSYATAGIAAGEPYWIAYEGNDFPENEGWERVHGDENGHNQGGAERWIEDGALVIDSRRHIEIYDSYTMSRAVNPGPGELFLMRWRLKVDEVSAFYDPSVVVFSDDSWVVAFNFSESLARSGFESGVSVEFDPGVFHDFELSSWDMRTYELTIDGTTALTGDFVPVFTASEVSWGDGWQGAASLARWDYFEFGVVPEMQSALAFGVGCTLLFFVKRRGI